MTGSTINAPEYARQRRFAQLRGFESTTGLAFGMAVIKY